jgi:hypothetical protein
MHGNTHDQLAAYLALGWALVPLHGVNATGCSCAAGAACSSAGKHPVARAWGEESQLVRSRLTLTTLMRARPFGNWGVATGTPSGVWVLDVDMAGDDAYNEWCDRYGDEWALNTLRARTGSSGIHMYFSAPADGIMPRNISKRQRRDGRVPPGIDVRGTGGQAVLPPSVSGKGPYAWLNWGSPILPAPDWLLALVREEHVESGNPAPADTAVRVQLAGAGISVPLGEESRGQAYAIAAVRGALEELRAAPVGTRNDTAFSTACRVVELRNAPWAGWAKQDDVRLYEAWWDAASAHPDGEHVPASELTAIWQSANRHVGMRAAELPESTMYGEYVPFALPPWAPSSQTGERSAGEQGGLFSDPGALSSGLSTNSVDNPQVSPTDELSARADAWERAVGIEMGRQAARNEARRRLEDAARLAGAGDRLAGMRARLLDRDALLALPAPAWLVPDVLQQDTLARLVGQPGHGKSFVALDLAAALGTGEDWAGRALPAHADDVGTARVLYVVGEAVSENGARVRAWEAAHGRKLAGVLFYPEPVQAADAGAWDALVMLAGELAPALVVIDTQARMTVGINENDPTDMGHFVEACERLRAASGACVLLVHHTPVGVERARGTGAVLGAMHSEILCRKDGRQVELRLLKQKGAPDGDDGPADLRFELAPAYLSEAGDGPFADPGEQVGVALRWIGQGSARPVRRHAISDLELMGHAGAAASIAAEVLSSPAAGVTKAEFAGILRERDLFTSKATWTRTFAKLLENRVIGQIRGTQRYRYIAPDDRLALIEPRRDEADGGAGFYVG